MNPAVSTDEAELRALVRQFLAEASPVSAVRRLMETAVGYDPAVWRRLSGELGLPGLIVPRQLGGAGAGWLELTVVLQEMGRALFCAPFLSTVLATAAILESGDEGARHDLLPPIAAGRCVATIAFTEDNGRWDAGGVDTCATPSGLGHVLDGHKAYVLDGHVADVIVVAARAPGGISLFAVDAEAPGLTRALSPTMDLTRRLARLELVATPARLLGCEGSGGEVHRRVLELAAVALAAEQVGGAQRCLEMAVAHAGSRFQFGRAIGSFQAVKHRCADMLVQVESARSTAEHAARAAAAAPAGTSDLPTTASLAKALCSEAYMRVAAANIQVHGALGFTWDHDAHLWFKRAASSKLLFGDPAYHRRLLAGRMGL